MRELPIHQVQAAWASYYRWVHEPFGTVHTQHLPDLWSRWSPGLDGEASTLMVEEATGEIVALRLLTPEAWQGRTMIVSETVHRHQSEGDRLLKATVAAPFAVLHRHGFTLVELEGHTTAAQSPGLIRSLPIDGGDPMDILELDRPK